MVRKRGGQPGNNNPGKNKPWGDALRKATIQGKGLDKIAKKVLKMAEDGDIQAIKEVGDRLDGKALQSIETSKADPFEGMTYEELEKQIWERFGIPPEQSPVSDGERQTH